MLSRLAIAIVAASLSTSPAALAQGGDWKSGRYWLRKCTSPEANGLIECANYVRALVEYDELRGSLGEKRFICPPKGLTIGQSREAVVKYLRDGQGDLLQPFVSLAHDALKAAYPCPAAASPARE